MYSPLFCLIYSLIPEKIKLCSNLEKVWNYSENNNQIFGLFNITRLVKNVVFMVREIIYISHVNGIRPWQQKSLRFSSFLRLSAILAKLGKVFSVSRRSEKLRSKLWKPKSVIFTRSISPKFRAKYSQVGYYVLIMTPITEVLYRFTVTNSTESIMG